MLSVVSDQLSEAFRAEPQITDNRQLTTFLYYIVNLTPTTARRDADGKPIPIADAESAGQLAALTRNAMSARSTSSVTYRVFIVIDGP